MFQLRRDAGIAGQHERANQAAAKVPQGFHGNWMPDEESD
jgi:hypothetical protein